MIAFDYDGVLVDSLDRDMIAINEICREMKLNSALTRHHVEQVENMTFDALTEQIGVPADIRPEFQRRVIETLQRHSGTMRFFPGIAEFIGKAVRRHLLVVVTSNETDLVKDALDSAGLLQHFSHVLGDGSISKAEKLTNLVAELNADKADTYMIGDAVSDIRQGKLAGVKTVAVSWGFQSQKRLLQEAPDLIAKTPQHLAELFAV